MEDFGRLQVVALEAGLLGDLGDLRRSDPRDRHLDRLPGLRRRTAAAPSSPRPAEDDAHAGDERRSAAPSADQRDASGDADLLGARRRAAGGGLPVRRLRGRLRRVRLVWRAPRARRAASRTRSPRLLAGLLLALAAAGSRSARRAARSRAASSSAKGSRQSSRSWGRIIVIAPFPPGAGGMTQADARPPARQSARPLPRARSTSAMRVVRRSS